MHSLIPKVEILEQYRYKFLWIDGELWMTDVPGEVVAQKYIAKHTYGDILITGYGLGVLQRLLTESENVSSVTTIEKNWGVVEACRLAYGYNLTEEPWSDEVLLGDFYKWDIREKYDCVVGDIWIDIAPECLSEYVMFKNRAKEWIKPNGKILAWGQDYFEYLLRNTPI